MLALALFLALPAAAVGTLTDLGREGNDYVARTFAGYRELHPSGACRALGSGRRVIVTGYGLFSGVPYNISGAVVRSMADPGFWPEQIRLDSPVAWRGQPQPARLAAGDRGGRAFNRTLYVDGERLEACFLVLDVIWDLAGAILVHEMGGFKPAQVLMTGRGGWEASFEAGAINRASPHPGYDSEGRDLGTVNRPVSDWLLPEYPVGHELRMSWDAPRLVRESAAELRELGYRGVAQPGARGDNDYLCNDISFVALNAAAGRPSAFAGGTLLLPSPELPSPALTGFLHFPAADQHYPRIQEYGRGVAAWGKIVSRVLASGRP